MTSIVQRMRAAVYDAAIVPLTAQWYRAVLERLPRSCRLLDIGIGTGLALLANRSLLESKDLYVTGIDIDRAYVERCRLAVSQQGLAQRVHTLLESIDDHRGGPYDASYFSGSFMLLPEPAAALRHVAGLLAPGGRIYFTQTFEHEPSRAVELVKPLLRFVTSIDFGRVTYRDGFYAALFAAGVAIDEETVLDAGRRRSSVLIVARPERDRG